ncbi:MAG: hypothetical protein U0736_21510 [Gemmataceae bacterium]
MASSGPPLPPFVSLDDDDRARNFRRRTTCVVASLVTVLTTAWVCTFGAIPAIISLAIAKHILVAILAMALGISAPREDE